MRTVNKSFIAFAAVLMSTPAWAQEAAGEAADAAKKTTESLGADLLFWSVAFALLFLVFFMFTAVMRASSIGAAEEAGFENEGWWARFDRKFFTRAIPVEKEKDHLLDHNYDGIQELDNSLPPWWKAGFYITVVFAVVYLLRFHVLGMGPDPEQEYQTEMKMAAVQIEEYLATSGEKIDEKSVTMADAAGIAEGAKIFAQSCLACHGAKGEGGVGPNLTDKFWLHGGAVNDVFKTIKYGVPEKGMQAWEKMFSPTQLKNLASYVKSLQGTNPPNGKAPQGEEYNEAAPAAKADSTAVAMK
ncbi:cytochrome c oxidase cbb3-type subunit 3 [Cnuella takakiae]|uniref:Cytochrome c oxidase cbb3-type subunit 3 n=1 Tax=Cnuella takakiae TaxID=1302690 RepID=A0A1M5A7C0_9BACT|nr:cbb3-type cytochrome c oxidase N-terminal domain-containing protein [Cnuella takakiae]SHF26064.1 cytochrome c oxidase cbb3-type subunit 3 [Cnuella takakiae]